MRLTHVGASALFILTNACSTGGGSEDTTDTTDTNTSANETSGNETSAEDTETEAQSVAPNTSAPSTQHGSTSNTTAAPNNTSANATSSPSTRPVDSDESESTTDETSADEPGDQTDDAAQADAGDQSDESDQSSDTTNDEVLETDADQKFSFFVTSYHHIVELSGSEDGFGGDLRYDGAATGLEGADAICQEIARRVGFGAKTWRAYLSTSTVDAIDRIGAGPWYDFVGALVANSPGELITGGNRQPGGCCEEGTYDELGLFHDGTTDQNNDGDDDDDHDTMTATLEDGTYAGFSCEDWTSTTATASGGGGGGGQMGGGPGRGGGIMMGHSWPARSGEHWSTSHGGHQCAAGTNFIQNGGGDSSTVGGGGGYGGIYCFTVSE